MALVWEEGTRLFLCKSILIESKNVLPVSIFAIPQYGFVRLRKYRLEHLYVLECFDEPQLAFVYSRIDKPIISFILQINNVNPIRKSKGNHITFNYTKNSVILKLEFQGKNDTDYFMDLVNECLKNPMNILSEFKASGFIIKNDALNDSSTSIYSDTDSSLSYDERNARASTNIKQNSNFKPSKSHFRLHQDEDSMNKISGDIEGFSNIGNTCYMNAILQSLLKNNLFLCDFLSTKQQINDYVPADSLYNLLCDLYQVREQNQSIQKEVLKKVKNAISRKATNFSGNQQHDAHEFLCHVLDQLKEDIEKLQINEIPSDLITANINPIVANFEFYVTHIKRCTKCNHISVKDEKFYNLCLDLPNENLQVNDKISIQDALNNFFRDEEVEVNCEKCKNNTAVVQHMFKSLPRIFILYLKRYEFFDAENVIKNECTVDLKNLLILRKLCDYDEQKLNSVDFLNVCPDHTKLISPFITKKLNDQLISDDALLPQLYLPPIQQQGFEFVIPPISLEYDEFASDQYQCQLSPLRDINNNDIEDSYKRIPERDIFGRLVKGLQFDYGRICSKKRKKQKKSSRQVPKRGKQQRNIVEYSNEINSNSPVSVISHLRALNCAGIKEIEAEKEDVQQLSKQMESLEFKCNRCTLIQDTDLYDPLVIENGIYKKFYTDGNKDMLKSLSQNVPPQEQQNDGTLLSKSSEDSSSRLVHDKYLNTSKNVILEKSYRLVGIVSHLGAKSNSGHYICDVLDFKSQTWSSFDDRKVEILSEENVLLKRSKTGYILYYTDISNIQ